MLPKGGTLILCDDRGICYHLGLALIHVQWSFMDLALIAYAFGPSAVFAYIMRRLKLEFLRVLWFI